MPSNPGFAAQGRYRTAFRVLGVGLVGIGLIMLGSGIVGFLANMSSDSMDAPVGAFARFLGGGLCLVVGAGLTNLGFMGAAARYGAGETMPVVRDSASYLTDGEGLSGVGRTVDDERTGRFCSRCGVRNDEGARFCDACGTALA